MKQNLAITVGAIVCSASVVMIGCGDGAEPQKRDQTAETTAGNPALVDGNPATTPGTTTPGTTTPGTTTPGTTTPGATAGGTTPPPASTPGAMPTGTTTPPPSTPAAGAGVAIIPDASGWVQRDTNTVGIQGAWYAYNDCTDSPGDCTTGHMPPEGEFANVDGKMCTSGTTAAVMADAEFSTKWGAGIALDLNGLGGAAGGKEPYDAAANGVKGFSFTIEMNVPSTIRVNLPTPATASASHFAEVSAAGVVMVTWTDVAQGSWIAMPDRVDLDSSQLLSLQFQIPSAMGMAIPFDFCVSNLKAIQ